MKKELKIKDVGGTESEFVISCSENLVEIWVREKGEQYGDLIWAFDAEDITAIRQFLAEWMQKVHIPWKLAVTGGTT
jgi:hypothetical protein